MATEESNSGGKPFRLPRLAVVDSVMVEYAVKRTGKTSDAVIRSGGTKVASLRDEGNLLFRLESTSNGNWKLNPRVHGEIRPFSMNVTTSGGSEEPVLTIRNHVFRHNGKTYILSGIPEDVRPAEHILGGRHICRLDTFQFSNLEDIDLETWGRLRRHRGVSVGTVEGFGLGEYKVRLSEELEDIGLQLSAASYLLYATA